MQKTDKKYLERWANMYSLARTIPKDRRFNMDTFGDYDAKSACGTTACLAGHAILHPWFRKRGFNKAEFEVFDDDDGMYIGEIEMDNDNLKEFWGSSEYDNPFDPSICFELSNCSGHTWQITPKQAAKAVKKWMLQSWTKDEVETAIDKATATYDAKWVHKYTPWDCPA